MMTNGLGWKLLLALNCVVLAGFALGWAYVALVVPLGAQARITALDRAGVINEGAVQKEYPQFADNVRGKLGPWIADQDHHAAMLLAAIGTLVAAINCVIVWMCRPKKEPPLV